MHAVHNARVQLLATAVNNLALAVIVAAFIAPATSGNLHGGWQAFVTMGWICLGIGLHFSALFTLGGLKA